jgi:hypothetical protein
MNPVIGAIFRALVSLISRQPGVPFGGPGSLIPAACARSALFENPATHPEPKSAPQVLSPASSFEAGDIVMQSKLAISALVVASLLGATAIASAQTQQPAPGASSEGNVGPGATGSKMKSDKMKSSKVKSGTTTGMNSGAQKGNKTDKYNNSK